MNLKIAARMLAVLSLAAAMTAAVMTLRDDGTEDERALHLRHPGGEPARSELVRCRDIGMEALDDADCRKAWTDHRRRFFETDKPDADQEPSP